jgi:hypothetical protein
MSCCIALDGITKLGPETRVWQTTAQRATRATERDRFQRALSAPQRGATSRDDPKPGAPSGGPAASRDQGLAVFTIGWLNGLPPVEP